jgi:hypothetical protein
MRGLLETMTAATFDLLALGLELEGNRAGAIAYAKARSCAGPRPWALALERLDALTTWTAEVDAVVRDVLEASPACFGFVAVTEYAEAHAAGASSERFGLELGERLAASGWCE